MKLNLINDSTKINYFIVFLLINHITRPHIMLRGINHRELCATIRILFVLETIAKLTTRNTNHGAI